MAKKRKKRRLKLGNLILVLAVIVGIGAGIFYLHYTNSLKSVQRTSELATFQVEEGQTSKTVLKNLQEQGFIKDADMAYLYAKWNSLGNMKTGLYEMDKSWDTKTILVYLNDSSSAIVDAATVTIVEGDWAKDIANKIASQTNVTAEELLQLWNNREYIESLMDKYPFLTEEMFKENVRIYLEGYLAPNTYQFFRETDAKTVTEKILDQSLSVYNSLKFDMEKSSYSIAQIYTLASIVQYEASQYEDMQKVAQVFYNRMDDGMMLQSSVTVCYAIDIDKGDDWMKCEVNPDFDSPYNTYKYTGLTPGPILNPGEEALKAVLNPNKDYKDYYFFMADVYGDGTIYYAKTLEEHEANVQKYLQ